MSFHNIQQVYLFCSKGHFSGHVSGLRSAAAEHAGHGSATSSAGCHDDYIKHCVQPAADDYCGLLATVDPTTDTVHDWTTTGVELHDWSWWPDADAGENLSGDLIRHVCN